jgi:hypothetical protein
MSSRELTLHPFCVPSFHVYDYKRQPRQTYYHASTAPMTSSTTQTTSAATASTQPVATPTTSEFTAARGAAAAAAGVAVPTAGTGPGLKVERTETPTAQLVSRTGVHVEDMIADGGGMGRNRDLYDDEGMLRKPQLS